MKPPYADRADAGRTLAAALPESLAAEARRGDVIVLALPRGGVPVAAEVARALEAPLDVFLVRKLGVPGQEELAMGAIASGGVRVMNEDVLRLLPLRPDDIERVARSELAELERRARLYRGDAPEPELAGKTVIVVDDGLATGASMRAAVRALRARQPARVVVAVPVGSAEACETLAAEVDTVVCPLIPPFFEAVGLWYRDFEQTTDAEVSALLAQARARSRGAPGDTSPSTPS